MAVNTAITAKQREMCSDILASIKYHESYESSTPHSLNQVLQRAGVENHGHFYSVVLALRRKGTPEALKLVEDIREGLAALGIRPSYLWVEGPKLKEPVTINGAIGANAVAGEEVEALNVCIRSLARFSQPKRENIINSVSMFYGLGAH
jgi:hypothetical protein